MTVSEEPLLCRGENARLVGILHRPAEQRTRGVLLVVGGPQYRVGSHRQFVLLARDLARRGFPVLRFDYRSMGDSEGPETTFESAGADVRAALGELTAATGVRDVVIWGLCDAASAALLHGVGDERVRGVVLVNPWVRQEQTHARTFLKHYYAARLLDPAFWRGLVMGRVNLFKSATDVARNARQTVGSVSGTAGEQERAPSFVAQMLDALESFRGKVLLILSGDDLTAAEFKDIAQSSRRWNRALARSGVERRDFPEANHTFSSAAWRDEVAACTARWLEAL
jgi:exosortase A-associated hydrolase 1